jgi:hypothetical protein
MKKILLHAIQPSYAERGDRDWKEFLRAAHLAELPKQTEHLAPNVWLLPDDQSYRTLSQIGQRWSIKTQVCRGRYRVACQALDADFGSPGYG